jgi:hypothetical protein
MGYASTYRRRPLVRRQSPHSVVRPGLAMVLTVLPMARTLLAWLRAAVTQTMICMRANYEIGLAETAWSTVKYVAENIQYSVTTAHSSLNRN